jgi:hypothetical protein
VRREEAGGRRPRGQVGVEAEDHVGLAPRAFELDAREKRRAVARPTKLQVAAAGRLERRFDRRGRGPIR